MIPLPTHLFSHWSIPIRRNFLDVQVAILEFCWNSRKNAMNERQSLCSEMAQELRYRTHFWLSLFQIRIRIGSPFKRNPIQFQLVKMALMDPDADSFGYVEF
jgi:hypothetical protein